MSQAAETKQHIQNLCHLQINGVLDRHAQLLYTAHGIFPTRYIKRSQTAWKAHNRPDDLVGGKRWLVYPKTTADGTIVSVSLVSCAPVDESKPEAMRLIGVLSAIDLTPGNQHAVFKVYRDRTRIKEGDFPSHKFTVSGLLPISKVPLKQFQTWEIGLGIEGGKLVARSAVLLKDAKDRKTVKGKPKKKIKEGAIEEVAA